MAICDDGQAALLQALSDINTTLASMDIRLDSIHAAILHLASGVVIDEGPTLIDVTQEANLLLTQQIETLSQANAISNAWATSEALLYSNVEVNVIPVELPPASQPPTNEDNPPEITDADDFGYTDTPVIFDPITLQDSIACAAAWELYRNILSFFLRLEAQVTGPQPPLTSGWMMDQLSAVAEWLLRDTNPVTYMVIPKPWLPYAAAIISAINVHDDFEQIVTEARSMLENNSQEIVNLMYCARASNTLTTDITDIMLNYFNNIAAIPEAARLASAFFLPPMLATLYWKPVTVDSLPLVNTEFCDCGS